jgi:hypothetical protein
MLRPWFLWGLTILSCILPDGFPWGFIVTLCALDMALSALLAHQLPRIALVRAPQTPLVQLLRRRDGSWRTALCCGAR